MAEAHSNAIPSYLTTWAGEPMSKRRRQGLNKAKRALVHNPTPEETVFLRFMSGFNVAKPGHVMWFTPQKEFHVNSEISFFVDFYYKQLKLAVELDGGQHYHHSGRTRDRWRSTLLTAHRVSVLRFKNSEVDDMPGVARKIVEWVFGNCGSAVKSRLRKHLEQVRIQRPAFYSRYTGRP